MAKLSVLQFQAPIVFLSCWLPVMVHLNRAFVNTIRTISCFYCSAKSKMSATKFYEVSVARTYSNTVNISLTTWRHLFPNVTFSHILLMMLVQQVGQMFPDWQISGSIPDPYSQLVEVSLGNYQGPNCPQR